MEVLAARMLRWHDLRLEVTRASKRRILSFGIVIAVGSNLADESVARTINTKRIMSFRYDILTAERYDCPDASPSD